MEAFPPPSAPPASAARPARSASTSRRPAPAAPSSSPDETGETDALAARLAALSARVGTSNRTTSRTAAARPSGSDDATPRTKSGSRRRHAARGARAAALGLSLASTGGLATLFAFTGVHSGNEVQGASIVATGASTASTGSAVTANEAAPSTVAPAASASDAVPTDVPLTDVPVAAAPAAAATTVINGAVFRNKWGDVQVEATFGSDGTLVDVTALQAPYRDGKSVRINDRAVPRLISEALTAQSANVDTVSGATYTSTDYRRSLQSAIDVAIDAGIVAPVSA